MNGVLLQAHHLVKRFGGVAAADDVSLTLKHGEVLGVIGPNGAGKSTLIGLLSGALAPNAGRIVFQGRDITRWPASERARHGIGRTYQIPRPFLDMSVSENLLAARYSLHPFARRADAHAAVQRILVRTGLADAAQRPARALPLLRRKRLEVARALALEPRLLLLDEVGAGLVDSEVSELISMIQGLRAEVDGIIIIEHVLRVVRECCERLAVLNFGRSFAEGPTAEVLASDDVAAVYLGSARGPSAPGASPAPAAVRTQPRFDALIAVPSTAAPDVPPLLELRGIHAGYGQARVLDGIDLSVRSGSAVAVLGINGAGKTTLASVINGSLRPTAGEVRVDGRAVPGRASHEMAALGVAPCLEGRRIFVPLSVEENLKLAARGSNAADMARRLDEVYALFPDLKPRRNLPGISMSGGQQQMLAIGRALMARPRLMVLDEVSLGLAPVVMDRLYEALRELKQAGLTMIVVEQDVERALELADEVHVMEHGRFALSGTAQAVRDDPRLRHLYIGSAD